MGGSPGTLFCEALRSRSSSSVLGLAEAKVKLVEENTAYVPGILSDL